MHEHTKTSPEILPGVCIGLGAKEGWLIQPTVAILCMFLSGTLAFGNVTGTGKASYVPDIAHIRVELLDFELT